MRTAPAPALDRQGARTSAELIECFRELIGDGLVGQDELGGYNGFMRHMREQARQHAGL
ncbi:hypothetical protein [Streptomyces smyrnaeus]|uniref:hypothetical protein n=1 Tax=Streptomyces smyrnaeus TaxID=1387713 RepID=UPI0015D494FF